MELGESEGVVWLQNLVCFGEMWMGWPSDPSCGCRSQSPTDSWGQPTNGLCP